MPLGNAIFLSTIALSILLLFWITKDRWNWKKLITRSTLIILVVGVSITSAIWGYKTFQERAVSQTELFGIKLDQTQSDIKFIKGEPDQVEENLWVYNNVDDESNLIILFRDNNIKAIFSQGECINCNKISGLGIGDTYDAVIAKFGQPTNISISKDQLKRLLSFSKYNVFFAFRKQRVYRLGIYNPVYGEIEFKEESNEESPNK